MTGAKNPALARTFEIRSSPHLHSGRSTDAIMFNVFVAVLPAAAFAVYAYGINALVMLVFAVGSCVGCERLLCRTGRLPSTVGDWSAAVTGLLYGLTLPPALPLWMVVTGGLIAIGVGKALFGGLGSNTFNPALVGRVALQGAFPVAMTTWHAPFAPDRFHRLLPTSLTLPFQQPSPGTDGLTAATPLAAMKFDGVPSEPFDLAFGFVGGSAGEASAILVLLGGLYLALRRMLNWRIPVAILITAAVFSAVGHALNPQLPGPTFTLFAGGLFFGAIFMATDMVTAPMTNLGVVLFGILIGLLVVVIRFWGGLPEGVQYSILFANGCSPLIDRLVQPRVYGTARRQPS